MNLQDIVLLLSLLTLSGLTFSAAQDPPSNSTRKEKSFSIFHVVNFKNGPCRSQMTFSSGTSSARNGTCYTQSECSQKGGTVSGNCASGFGVCCVFIFTATSSPINQNNSYIQNPGFPAGYTQTTGLTYTINKCSENVCWIRLDFESFLINGPADTVETAGGACTDMFKVTTNTNQVIPTICGSNAGQHIYIDVGALANDNVMLQFTFTGVATATRTWDIRESQIECSNPNRPPNGCLQYFSTLQGRITTFNFIPATGSSHLALQDYSSCVRRESGYCCIQYQVCPDIAAIAAFTLDQTKQTAKVDTNCANDYVGIPGSSAVCTSGTNTLSSKYCGDYLNQFDGATTNVPICDCTSPFFVHFRTEGAPDTGSGGNYNRGVCLEYTQLPCSS